MGSAPPEKLPWIETPLIESGNLSQAAGCRVFLKLENLQPSGSFKSRGLGNLISKSLSESRDPSRVHFYSSSGGNAGLAAVHAARHYNRPCTVVVPNSTKPHMIARLRAAGANDVIQIGDSWKEADQFLRDELLSKDEGGVYCPPFDHPHVWAGNGSMIQEIQGQLREMEETPPDIVVCSVGGGGLLNGVVEGIDRAGWHNTQVLAVETDGAESLSQSLEAGQLVTLKGISSQATSLGATRVAEKTFEIGRRKNVQSVVLSDAEAAMGCWRLADDEKLLVEMACGVSVALAYDGKLEKYFNRPLTKDTKVVIVVCGGSNVSVDMVAGWRKEFGSVEKKAATANGVPSSETAPVRG